jgi:hypothetical protein
MAAPEILLMEEQRLEFTQIPENISEWEIARYYTFTDYDKEIINRHRIIISLVLLFNLRYSVILVGHLIL